MQVAEVNDAKFEVFVQDLWREVGLVEGSEEAPRLKIDTTFIDMGAFSCVNQCIRECGDNHDDT